MILRRTRIVHTLICIWELQLSEWEGELYFIEKVCTDSKWLPPKKENHLKTCNQTRGKGKIIQRKLLKMLHVINKISSAQLLKFTEQEIKNHWCASECRYTALIFHGMIFFLQIPWKSSTCFGIKKLPSLYAHFR